MSCGNTLLLRSSTGELSDLALLARPSNSGRSSAAQHEKSGNVEVCRPVVGMDGTDLGGVSGGSDRGDAMNAQYLCDDLRAFSYHIPQDRTSRVSSALETANGKYDCALYNLASLPVIAGRYPGSISSFALSCMTSSFSPPAFAFHIASISLLSSLPKATNLILDTAPPIIILTLSIARKNVTVGCHPKCVAIGQSSQVLSRSELCKSGMSPVLGRFIYPLPFLPLQCDKKRSPDGESEKTTSQLLPSLRLGCAARRASCSAMVRPRYIPTYIATWVEGPGCTVHSYGVHGGATYITNLAERFAKI
ncbi:hypothetical protein GE21DRAFT_1312395 [Neurospora crassa]|nr:hypothetical protein B23L21.330 [imported] - Neurospora crassa [Neurospora crassa]KHE80086.1 hypothetical protein GE21DRAFT_1312395 [Neurospora crassa]